MEKFGVLEAAFDVFKRREKHGVLTRALIAYVLVVWIVGLALLSLMAPAFLDFMRWSKELEATQQFGQLPPRFGELAFGYLAALPLILGAYVAFETAVHRWLVRGEAGGGLMGLKIDGHFWNVLLCLLTWIPVSLAIMLVVGIVAGLGIGGGIAAGGGLIGFVLGLVGVLAAIALAFYLPARFAPASALSVARGRYSFFQAWGATKSRTLNLIGAFLILIGLLYAVSIAWSLATQGLVQPLTEALISGAGMGEAVAEIGIGAAVVLIVSYLAATIFQMVMMLALYGVNAKLARVATHQPPAPAEAAGAAVPGQ